MGTPLIPSFHTQKAKAMDPHPEGFVPCAIEYQSLIDWYQGFHIDIHSSLFKALLSKGFDTSRVSTEYCSNMFTKQLMLGTSITQNLFVLLTVLAAYK